MDRHMQELATEGRFRPYMVLDTGRMSGDMSGVGKAERTDRRTPRGAVTIVLLSLILVACTGGGSPDKITYRDSENRSLFELPKDWNLYRADELMQAGTVPFLPNTGANIVSYVAFDGAAGRNLGNLVAGAAGAPYPLGAQIIRQVSADEKDLISNYYMATSTYATSNPSLGVQIIQLDDDPGFDREYDGVVGYLGVTQGGDDLQGVIYLRVGHNPDGTELYSMAVGCSLDCFRRQQQEIEQAVDSWVVNTRR